MKSFRSVVNGRVTFNISPSSPCPCGSSIPTEMCCLTNFGFHKKSSLVTPPQPWRNHSLIGCYASELADCNEELSREHFISESLLLYLNSSKNLTVGGFPWLGSESRVLPPSALASKILCSRHNNALSPLHNIAVRLFNAFDERGAIDSNHQLLYLFSGHDLERWLLKILCGIAFSGNLKMDFPRDTTIPREWCKILYGYSEFTNGCGLYVCKEVGHQSKNLGDLALRAITNKERLTGLGLYICGLELILSMPGLRNRRFDNRQFTYRPYEFYIRGSGFEKSVVLSWDGPSDKGIVSSAIFPKE